MSTNPTPWVALAVIVLVSLFLKGYLKLPAGIRSAPAFRPSVQVQGHTDAILRSAQAAPNPNDLVQHGSFTLGIAFAKAKRLEAEERIAFDIASEAGRVIEATFTAPFSKPPAAPAGPSDPIQAGPQPPS